MQNKCTTVISHLANISCSSVKRLSIHKEQATVSTDNAELRVAHVLSMDAVLNVGLDVGQVGWLNIALVWYPSSGYMMGSPKYSGYYETEINQSYPFHMVVI